MRIKDVFTAKGRKLFESEKREIAEMEAKYALPAMDLAAELRWVRIVRQLMHMQIDIAAAKKHTPSGIIEETSCGS